MFKVGDKVRVLVDRPAYSGLKKGEEKTITRITEELLNNSKEETAYYLDNLYFVFAEHIELVGEKITEPPLPVANKEPKIDTLRLQIATLMAQGLLAGCKEGVSWPTSEELAEKSFEYADALLDAAVSSG